MGEGLERDQHHCFDYIRGSTRCVPDSQSEPRKAVPEPPLED